MILMLELRSFEIYIAAYKYLIIKICQCQIMDINLEYDKFNDIKNIFPLYDRKVMQ